MGIIGCMECGSVHRNTQQYAQHIKLTKHEKVDQMMWYVARIGKNEGVFVQAAIQEIGWIPFYTVQENETETVLHICTAETENISLLLDRREICEERTFDYFDAELSIYTVHLQFRAHCRTKRK
ncbi:hypothetical protein NEAUS03_1315 [Nematocida ausubeli]|nr:hypothetical protein NEAUS03_1315 [Nematocida ausubeli]